MGTALLNYMIFNLLNHFLVSPCLGDWWGTWGTRIASIAISFGLLLSWGDHSTRQRRKVRLLDRSLLRSSFFPGVSPYTRIWGCQRLSLQHSWLSRFACRVYLGLPARATRSSSPFTRYSARNQIVDAPQTARW